MKSLVNIFSKHSLLTEKQAAEILGNSPSTLKWWRNQKKGPKYVKVDTKTIRYRFEDLIDYIGSQLSDEVITTRVLKNGLLDSIVSNDSLRDHFSDVITEYENKQPFVQSPEVVNKLSVDNINNLNWAIDKLWLNIYLSNSELPKLLTKLDNISQRRNGLVKEEGAAGYFSYHYSVRLRSKRDLSFILLAEPRPNGFNHIQLQLNPARLNKDKDLKQFLKVIKILFNQCPVALLMHSQVRRYDICVDIPDAEVDLILFRFKNARKSTIVRRYSDGKVVYRKEGVRKRQLVKVYQKDDGSVRLEFEDYLDFEETELPNQKLSRPLLINMPQHQGPFKRLELYLLICIQN